MKKRILAFSLAFLLLFGMVVVPVPIKAETTDLIWEEPSASLPLGSASYFGVVSFGDYKVAGADVESGAVVGGNFYVPDGASYGIGLPIDATHFKGWWTPGHQVGKAILPHDPRLVVQGSMYLGSGVHVFGGSTYVADKSKISGHPSAGFLSSWEYLGTDPYTSASAGSLFKQTVNMSSANNYTLAKEDASGVAAFINNAKSSLKAQSASNAAISATDTVLVYDVTLPSTGDGKLEPSLAGGDYSNIQTIVYNLTCEHSPSVGATAIAANEAGIASLNLIFPESFKGNVVINMLPDANNPALNTFRFVGGSIMINGSTKVAGTSLTGNAAVYELAREYGGRILFNYPDTSMNKINMKTISIIGSMLAPYSDFYVAGGSVNGNLIVNSFEVATGTGFEVHNMPYEGSGNAPEEPVTEPPVTEPPVTEPPVTEPPVTEPPVTEPPVTEPPVTEPPVTEPPVTEPPTEPTTDPRDFVNIIEKSAEWVDIDNYLAEVLIKIKGSQVVEPVDIVVCLDKSGSMDMNFLMPGTSQSHLANTPFASCPCLNQDHFYLDVKKIDGVEVEASFEGVEPSKDSLVYDEENETLTVYDADKSKWTVLDASNEIHKLYMFALNDIYPYHFKKDSSGNYVRISEWESDAAVAFWNHADENEGCFDRWMEAKSSVKTFLQTVVDTNSNNNVALVPFSERDFNEEFYVNWTRDTGLIDSKIDGLTTTTSTDHVYGLSMAYNLLNNRTAEAKATKKAIVLFISDGVPDPQGGTLSRSGKIVAFYNSPAHINELANAIKGDENWAPNPSMISTFWNMRSGAYQRHDVKTLDVVGMDATIVSLALMIENNQTAILQGMASRSEFLHNLTAEQFVASPGLLTESLLNMTFVPAGRKTVVTDKISEYFVVDESRLSDDLKCITDPNTGEQTVVWNVGDIYDEELSIKIPLILKEEYRNDQELTYYPTNKDTDEPGAKVEYIDPFDDEKTDYHETPELPYEKQSPPESFSLGWMRSTEIPLQSFLKAVGGEGDAWSYDEAFAKTPIKYFEDENVQAVANAKAASGSEYTVFDEQLVGMQHIWDCGTYFPLYKEQNGNAPYDWASWKHHGESGNVVDKGEYSIRRITAYLNFGAEELNGADSVLLAPEDELGNMSYLFPINDNVFVYVNGELAFWGGTDVVEGNNQYGALNRTVFDGEDGIKVRNGVNGVFKDIYPHTDGWCIDLEENADAVNIKPFLKEGFNRIDIFADEYWEGGGMNRLNLYVQ